MLAPILVALLAGLSSAYTIISYSDNNCQVRIRTVAESTGVSARYWIISDNDPLRRRGSVRRRR
jgi:hypothetical protein